MRKDKSLEKLNKIYEEIKNMSDEEFIKDYKRLEKIVEGRKGKIILPEEINYS